MKNLKCKTLGEVNDYLGMHVERHPGHRWLKLHQEKFIKELGEKYGIENERKVATPVPVEFKLVRAAEDEGVEVEEQQQFQRFIRGPTSLSRLGSWLGWCRIHQRSRRMQLSCAAPGAAAPGAAAPVAAAPGAAAPGAAAPGAAAPGAAALGAAAPGAAAPGAAAPAAATPSPCCGCSSGGRGSANPPPPPRICQPPPPPISLLWVRQWGRVWGWRVWPALLRPARPAALCAPCTLQPCAPRAPCCPLHTPCTAPSPPPPPNPSCRCSSEGGYGGGGCVASPAPPTPSPTVAAAAEGGGCV
ncbi:unnamed protein product [Closterium sp. NIES-53]